MRGTANRSCSPLPSGRGEKKGRPPQLSTAPEPGAGRRALGQAPSHSYDSDAPNRRDSMSVHASHVAPSSAATGHARGRALYWAGLLACLVGLVAVVAQFGLKILGVPWYSPILATLGAVLILLAVIQGRT